MDRRFRSPRKARRHAPLANSLFFDATAHDIERACRVSHKTALDWMAGRKKPSDRAALLFDIFHHQRVLTDAWRGWKVSDRALVSPDGWWFRPGGLMAAWWPGVLCAYCGHRSPIGWEEEGSAGVRSLTQDEHRRTVKVAARS